MTKYIGEVRIIKTNIESGEVTTYNQYNTQLLGLYRNLSETNAMPAFSSNNTASQIYISDNDFPLTRLHYTPASIKQTFNVGGTFISGEYWPQYNTDAVLKRATFTFKQRFSPGTSTRTINTISLYTPSYGQYFAALQLQTPCIQTSLDIIDIYYKIYVYYDSLDNVDDYNFNKNYIIKNNLISRWFYSYGFVLYNEGTNTVVNPNSNNWYNYLGIMFVDSDLNDYTASYNVGGNSPSNYYTAMTIASPTNTVRNTTQGTTIQSRSMGVDNFVGYIINKISTTRLDIRLDSSWSTPVSSTYVLGRNESLIQSVYLKSANSTDTNFAYLDPSTIGSSTASLVLNDNDWTQKWRPSMFKINIVEGGDINSARYNVSIRNSFGFLNNFFNNENSILLNNTFYRVGVDTGTHTSNTVGNALLNAKRIDNRTVVSSSPTGITIHDVYLANFVNYNSTSTPSLVSNSIQDAIPMPDGSILITSLDKGLMKLSSDRTTITNYTGLGSGVSDNICYAAAVKTNGDIWAMFEGGLAKYNSADSTWTVYNSTTPITFTASNYNPNWSNTLGLYCRKDGDDDELAIVGISNRAITWWSPSNPTTVVTTDAGDTSIYKNGNIRANYSTLMCSLPNSNVWFFPNNNRMLSKITFRTNTATVVNTYTMSSFKPCVLNPVLYNGQWAIQSVENPNNRSTPMTVRWYSASSVLFTDTNTNKYWPFDYYNMVNEVMDEYGTSLYSTSSGSITGLYNVMLIQILTPLSTNSWRNYGWNSSNSTWELNNNSSKPVHTTAEILPEGLKCSFVPTGTNDFITNERWIGYITDGIHKDNSTTAVLGTAVQTRSYYETNDLSSPIVPITALGTVTEKVSGFTCVGNSSGAGVSQAASWNGGISAAYYDSSSNAASVKSELTFTGDFTFNFWTNPYAGVNSESSSTAFIGLYDPTAPTVTSKWAFRFSSSGYAVTEDDVTKTSVIVPTIAQKYTIKRVGNTVSYLVNDVLFYTSTISSGAPLRAIFRMPYNDSYRTFYNMSVTYNETRPVVKIGDIANQTGVYDPNYAMIEAWLTAPATHSITIDGVAATVITDPSIAPLPGQVLLLQKCGWLVFNPADAGKPITCSAVVLLET